MRCLESLPLASSGRYGASGNTLKRLITSVFSALCTVALSLGSGYASSADAAQKDKGSVKREGYKSATHKTIAYTRAAESPQKRRIAKSASASKRKSIVKTRPVVIIPAKPSFGEVAGLHSSHDALDLKSSVALVIDQDTREVLFSKNEQAVLPIASLTKLMTGLIISEAKLPADEIIMISQADVDTEKEMNFPPGGFASSVKVKNLDEVENLLRNLWSPKWPEAAFGKPDQKLVDAGAVLFSKHCAECHESINRTDPNRKVTAIMRDVHTDQSMARNAATRTSESGVFKNKIMLIPAPHVIAETEPVSTLLTFLGQRTLLGANFFPSDAFAPMSEVKVEINEGSSKLLLSLSALDVTDGKMKMARVKSLKLWQAGRNPITRDGEDLKDLAQLLAQDFEKVKGESEGTAAKLMIDDMKETPVMFQDKGRPMNGIWATAPYLHNGSVPTLDDLLKPASARKATFKLGSREFDPVKVGYVDEGDFIFDTKANPGNSNAGHEYGETVFTDAERAQLIEYMKTL